jgi:hypothetical protein
MSNFLAILWREQVTLEWDEDICFVINLHTELGFYSASSLKQHSIRTHYPDFKPNSLYSNSLTLHA